jgi:hypothetical protein
MKHPVIYSCIYLSKFLFLCNLSCLVSFVVCVVCVIRCWKRVWLAARAQSDRFSLLWYYAISFWREIERGGGAASTDCDLFRCVERLCPSRVRLFHVGVVYSFHKVVVLSRLLSPVRLFTFFYNICIFKQKKKVKNGMESNPELERALDRFRASLGRPNKRVESQVE